MKSSTVLEVSILGLTVLIGIILRIIPLRYGAYFSTEADTMFMYRVTKYVVDNGYAAWFNWHDTLSWYPWGRDIPATTYPGLPFTAAAIYSILQALGLNLSLYTVCLFFPVFMASLTIIAVYFLGKDIGGRSVGLLSAFLMAVNSSYISRTSMGFFDDETVGIFSLVLISLFFLRAVEAEKPLHKCIVYAVGAGLMAGYLNASWGAARYALGLVSLFVLISLLVRFYNRRYLISYSITVGLSYFIAVFIPRLGASYLQSMDSVAIIGFFALIACFEIVRGRVDFRKLILLVGASLAVLIIALLILESAGLIYPISMKFIAVIFPGSRVVSPIIESVAEHKRASWGIYFSDFGFSIALALLGLYFAVKKPSDKKLYGLVFFLSGLYFSGSFVRLFLILSVPLVVMAAYGVKELLNPFMVIASQKSADRLVRRRRVFGLGRGSGILFIIIILGALLPSVWSAADNLKTPSTMAATVPVLIGGNYPQDWLQALNWMRDNLPGDAVVVSWWDYGYWIQTLSGKRTLADGATINTTQIAQIGKIMMLGENVSLKILKSFNATHIVVYTTFNPNNPSQELPFGDNAKWYWMVKIAGLNETEYINNNQYADKYYESTLYKLMKNLVNQTYFRPVYKSSYGWVIVYEIRYPSDEGL
ncbi:hypothetical protein KEJ21_01160 [Candidatus Bathyarchaeota archaeon]|nr:hypothetical protein [Candidatus Bathyarchaeota archaeon]